MVSELKSIPEPLFDDLLRIPALDPHLDTNDLSEQGYILLIGQDVVLIDTSHEAHLPALRALRAEGRRIAGLVLTHAHSVPRGDILRRIEGDLASPVFLHPLDAQSERAKAAGVRYLDPTRSEQLAALGIEAALFPGHTPGHVILFWGAHGVTLFAGDAAVGARRQEHRAGRARLVRPPLMFTCDDAQLRQSWADFDRKVTCVLPLHGEAILDRAEDMPALMAPLRRADAVLEISPP